MTRNSIELVLTESQQKAWDIISGHLTPVERPELQDLYRKYRYEDLTCLSAQRHGLVIAMEGLKLRLQEFQFSVYDEKIIKSKIQLYKLKILVVEALCSLRKEQTKTDPETLEAYLYNVLDTYLPPYNCRVKEVLVQEFKQHLQFKYDSQKRTKIKKKVKKSFIRKLFSKLF